MFHYTHTHTHTHTHIYIYMYVFFFRWHHSPLWALACRTMPLHFSLSITNSLHLLTPSTWRSLSTSSLHPFLGLLLRLVPSSSWVKIYIYIYIYTQGVCVYIYIYIYIYTLMKPVYASFHLYVSPSTREDLSCVLTSESKKKTELNIIICCTGRRTCIERVTNRYSKHSYSRDSVL